MSHKEEWLAGSLRHSGNPFVFADVTSKHKFRVSSEVVFITLRLSGFTSGVIRNILPKKPLNFARGCLFPAI
jgi:hypothetical protein